MQNLERRMDAFENTTTTKQSKRKVVAIDEDFAPGEGAGGAGAAAAAAAYPGPPSSSDEALLQQVMTHFKPLSDLEWTRKMSVTQADPAKLDGYFTALVQSLVIGGYMDSFTAWQHRFVMPVSTIFKQRAVDTYHMKNLMVLMNLQTKVKRGKQASEAMLEIMKQRSTYEKVMDLVRRVARGEKLVYEPTFAALNLEASAPKRSSTGGRKKLFAQKAAVMDDDSDDDVFGAGHGAGGGGSDDDEDAAEAEAEVEAEAEADEHGADEASDDSDCERVDMEEDYTQPQPMTQVPPPPTPPMEEAYVSHSTPDVVSNELPPPPPTPPMEEPVEEPSTAPTASIEKFDLFAMPSAAVAAVPSVTGTSATTNPLRRFMAKKAAVVAAPSVAPSASSAVPSVPVHPMMEAMAALSWEPLDVNRHGMVQLSTGACDSYMNWYKAFDADSRVENRYVEYTRANGERSSVINYYVRFFTARPCPLVSPAESVTTMKTSELDTIYMRWIGTLTKTESYDSLREALL